jgi:hypothetical protein
VDRVPTTRPAAVQRQRQLPTTRAITPRSAEVD